VDGTCSTRVWYLILVKLSYPHLLSLIPINSPLSFFEKGRNYFESPSIPPSIPLLSPFTKGGGEGGFWKRGRMKKRFIKRWNGRWIFPAQVSTSFPKMGPGGINGEVEIIEIL